MIHFETNRTFSFVLSARALTEQKSLLISQTQAVKTKSEFTL